MSAARMRTASSPSRKTMMAAFVTTETSDCGPLPICCSERASASSSAARVDRDLLVGRMAAEKLDEAVVALRAVPEVALDLLEQRRRETAQSLLGTELEDAVRLESRLLGLFPVAGRSSGLQAVERRGDDVEVGRLRRFLPLGRVQRADEREGVVGRCPDGVGVGNRIAARGVGESRSELVECGAQARGRARVGRGERGAEVDECRRRPVAKRDRLLDLELECHPPVLHAPAVLDRDEPKEAIELARRAARAPPP